MPSIARSKPFAHSRQAAFCFGVKNVTVPNQLEREAIELLIAAYREVRNAQKLYVLVKRDLDPTRYSISVHSLTGYNGVGKGAAHVLKAKGWANLRSDNLDIDDVFCLTADGLIAGAEYEAEYGPFVFYEDDEELAAIDQAIAHGLAAADELLGEGWNSGPEWGKAPLDVAAGPEEAEPGYEPVRNRQRLRIDWKAAEEAWKNEQFEKGFRELEWLIWSKQAARRSITSQTMNPDQYEGPNAVTQSSPMAPPAPEMPLPFQEQACLEVIHELQKERAKITNAIIAERMMNDRQAYNTKTMEPYTDKHIITLKNRLRGRGYELPR